MITKYDTFDAFVIAVVMLTGAGFGVLSGLVNSAEFGILSPLVNSADFWWIGMVVGAVSGFPLAKLYLRRLPEIAAKGYSTKVAWLLSTRVAIKCGLICTVVTHVIMVVIGAWSHNWLILLIGSGLIGASAGLVVGGICSYMYVLLEKDDLDETS